MIRRIALLFLAALLLSGYTCAPEGTGGGQAPSGDAIAAADATIEAAFAGQRHNVQVAGSGTVTRVLSDDHDGSRHQRFILELASGHTLLIAHNIDVAPRIPDIREGDVAEFSGVYEYNDQGGVIHWTHHDPDGHHEDGWLQHEGTVYE